MFGFLFFSCTIGGLLIAALGYPPVYSFFFGAPDKSLDHSPDDLFH